jgi:4-alpha-glucanotransferase
MYGQTRSFFFWTTNAGRAFWREFHPIISALKDNYGGTQSTTGSPCPHGLRLVHRSDTRIAGPRGCIRLDHFRAFAAAWYVPAGARTAESGEWVSGPGAEFFNAVRNKLGGLPFIAEDLGLITPDVSALRDELGIPGTRVLQFAFDGSADNVHLPQNYATNTVVYTSTHDNATTREWFQDLPERERQRFWDLVKRPEGEIPDATPELIRLAWTSPAALAITPFQDLLNLGREGRMNVPGLAHGNWRWRATRHMLSPGNFQWLKDLTERSNRFGSVPAMEAASRGHPCAGR